MSITDINIERDFTVTGIIENNPVHPFGVKLRQNDIETEWFAWELESYIHEAQELALAGNESTLVILSKLLKYKYTTAGENSAKKEM